MLGWFGSKREAKAASRPAAPAIPSGRLCYAIGDIHGELALLEKALAAIRYDAGATPHDRAFVVFVGDLIDRGPDSRGVIELLASADWNGIQPVFLMGNHEEVFLDVLGGDVELLSNWVTFGGDACAESYGVSLAPILRGDWMSVLLALRAAVPEHHVAFLRDFHDSFELGDYLFVHAGVRPGIDLDDQRPRDLRWIREDFLFDESDFGKVIVHGHTVSEAVEFLPNRIGIDTGAYASGRLSVLRLIADQQSLLSIT